MKIDQIKMVKKFTEFATNAQFSINDISYLSKIKDSQQIGEYSFIWTSDEALEVRIDQVPLKLEPNSIMALTPIQHLTYVSGGENAIVYQFNREFYCIKEHDQTIFLLCPSLLNYATSM